MRILSLWIIILLAIAPAFSQTATTGQIAGEVRDTSQAVIPGATVVVTGVENGIKRKVVTDKLGAYIVPLLPPGTYQITVSGSGFKADVFSNIGVLAVTPTTVNAVLQVGTVDQQVVVAAGEEILQTDNSSNGTTVNEVTVTSLPTTNRNFTQITQLSPGVSSALPNAATLGLNDMDVNVNGARASDNEYQLDGEDEVNMQEQGTAGILAESGLSVPSPDAIQEFRMQTGQYDASYGRGAGAQVDIVTKSGTNALHGAAFEFLRNPELNANDYFRKLAGDSRPVLRQNQFGGTLGGPFLKNRLFYFVSYEGTTQANGEGSASLQSFQMPLLGNSAASRTAAALGSEFAGESGYFGGTTIASNGSNINPVALALLNYTLPNGSYLIPAPQITETPSNVNSGGFSSFSVLSTFQEQQVLGNLDYSPNAKDSISERYFWAHDTEGSAFSTTDLPGAPTNSLFENTNAALHWTHIFGPTLLNEAKVGFHRIYGNVASGYPVTNADIGMTPSCDSISATPDISISGLFNIGGTFNDGQWSNTKAYMAGDQLTWIRGSHSMRMGGDVEHTELPFADPQIDRGQVSFESFPDFLLGLSAAQNGSDYSNLDVSESICGNTQKDYRITDSDIYYQDDYTVTPHLTINLGMRMDVYGQITDTGGRFATFWPNLASNSIPAGGTYTGFVVPHNFPTTVPTGIATNWNNTFAANPESWNVGPRVGFSWTLPGMRQKAVLRGGYGLYYARTSISDAYQFVLDPPFLETQYNSATLNSLATFQNPWNPAAPNQLSDYPIFPVRTYNSELTLDLPSPKWQAPMGQQKSLEIQFALSPNTSFQVGYFGTNESRIEATRNINQALATVNPASPNASTFTGPTTASANIQSRVPILGMSGITQAAEIGISNYNALQVLLQRRMSRGLQVQVAYTYSNTLTNVTGNGTFAGGKGSIDGDAYNLMSEYGRASFGLPQRVVGTFLWEIPYSGGGLGKAILGNWGLSGVASLQSGFPLTIGSLIAGNIYGSSGNAQLCPNFSIGNIVNPGPVNRKLSDYFNASSVSCTPPAVGNGYSWGNTRLGTVQGPGEHNLDVSISREFSIRERVHAQLRGEFYNAFNTPQFSNPGTTYGSSSFGVITSSSVAPRLIQLGLKAHF
jgi:Carboxypeptidase regulatory-like domain